MNCKITFFVTNLGFGEFSGDVLKWTPQGENKQYAVTFRCARVDGKYRMYKMHSFTANEIKESGVKTQSDGNEINTYEIIGTFADRLCDNLPGEQKDNENSTDMAWLDTVESAASCKIDCPRKIKGPKRSKPVILKLMRQKRLEETKMGQEKHNTKRRKWEQLTEKERYKIKALYQQGLKASEIGKALTPKRDRRTIEREIAQGMTLQRNSDFIEKRYTFQTLDNANTMRKQPTKAGD